MIINKLFVKDISWKKGLKKHYLYILVNNVQS